MRLHPFGASRRQTVAFLEANFGKAGSYYYWIRAA